MTRFCAVSVSTEPQLEPLPWRLPEALPSGELQLAEQLDLPQALVAVLRRGGYGLIQDSCHSHKQKAFPWEALPMGQCCNPLAAAEG